MADRTLIEWTDTTWQPITGCSVVSPGCTNCYAMKLAGGRLRHHPSRAGLTVESKSGPVWNGEVRFNEEWLIQPLRWKQPRKIFACAHGDLFHPSVPFGWVMRVFNVMALTPRHTYQVVTKRPDRMAEFFRRWRDVDPEADWDFKGAQGPDAVRVAHPSGRGQLFAEMLESMGSPPPGCAYPFFDWAGGMSRWPDAMSHIWLGVSVEDQPRADERRAPMAELAAEGWTTFTSYEPALGPVDWSGWEFLRWLIAGGESGPDARPSHPDWHRTARDFCGAHGIAFFFKQWGEFTPLLGSTAAFQSVFAVRDTGAWHRSPDGICGLSEALMLRVGKKAAGRILDGSTHSQFPEVA